MVFSGSWVLQRMCATSLRAEFVSRTAMFTSLEASPRTKYDLYLSFFIILHLSVRIYYLNKYIIHKSVISSIYNAISLIVLPTSHSNERSWNSIECVHIQLLWRCIVVTPYLVCMELGLDWQHCQIYALKGVSKVWVAKYGDKIFGQKWSKVARNIANDPR